MRTSLDDVGIAVARAWAGRGTCGRRQVGCALFDATGHLLSTGYNGPASGVPNCTDSPCPGRDLPSGTGLSACEAIHAEANALLRCSDVTKVHTCYVTHSPCLDCVKLLMNTGCKRVVYAEAYAHDAAAAERWTRETVYWSDASEDYVRRTWHPHVSQRVPVRAWAVVDVRSGQPGKRYIESVVMRDTLGLPTKDRPPELPGWRVVEMTGHYDDPTPLQPFIHGHCPCPTPMRCSFKSECAKGLTFEQRRDYRDQS